MTSEAEALLPKVESAVEAAVRKISSDHKLGNSVAAWDGARRVWTLRNHEAGNPVFIEAITSIAVFPTYAMKPEEAREVTVEITARAWSTEYRHAPQERLIYAKLLKDATKVPSGEELEALLADGLGEAEELAGQLPEAAKRLESFLVKGIGHA